MGIYSPRGKFSYSGGFSEQAGNFALVSQSGDLTNRIISTLNTRGIYFSQAASIGNSISLSASDFIDFYNNDEKLTLFWIIWKDFPNFVKRNLKVELFSTH